MAEGVERADSRPAPSARILLVEDDATIAELIAFNLRRAGYEVLQAQDGRTGLHTALSEPVDLVLMDILLPGMDGLSASKEILRARPGLPIVLLSAVNEREKVLEGFAIGAEDYITKPFDLEMLLARIGARLRRTRALQQEAPPEGHKTLRVGDLILDSDCRSLRNLETKVRLTPKEFEIVRLLLGQPGRLFSKEEITRAVWHQRYLPSSRTLEVHMRRLRHKLGEVGATLTIHVVRGAGYRLVSGSRVRPVGGS